MYGHAVTRTAVTNIAHPLRACLSFHNATDLRYAIPVSDGLAVTLHAMHRNNVTGTALTAILSLSLPAATNHSHPATQLRNALGRTPPFQLPARQQRSVHCSTPPLSSVPLPAPKREFHVKMPAVTFQDIHGIAPTCSAITAMPIVATHYSAQTNSSSLIIAQPA